MSGGKDIIIHRVYQLKLELNLRMQRKLQYHEMCNFFFFSFVRFRQQKWFILCTVVVFTLANRLATQFDLNFKYASAISLGFYLFLWMQKAKLCECNKSWMGFRLRQGGKLTFDTAKGVNFLRVGIWCSVLELLSSYSCELNRFEVEPLENIENSSAASLFRFFSNVSRGLLSLENCRREVRISPYKYWKTFFVNSFNVSFENWAKNSLSTKMRIRRLYSNFFGWFQTSPTFGSQNFVLKICFSCCIVPWLTCSTQKRDSNEKLSIQKYDVWQKKKLKFRMLNDFL
jgi:hypothetical protein